MFPYEYEQAGREYQTAVLRQLGRNVLAMAKKAGRAKRLRDKH
ncbi:hypothetical protein ACFLQY_04970 [Verrucomicrobiota bacterium]